MKILDHQAEHHDPGLLRQTISSYINLIKPHVTVLLLGTTVAAMAIAKRGLPDLGLILATLVAGTMAAGSANCINCYIDRDIDQLMTRTRRRSLPAGKVQPAQALIFGLILGVGSFVVFTIFVNLLCACLGLAAILFYVFIYTLWLKRSSTQNIVIGGAAGAVPVLIGWAAISNSVPLAAIWLFAIIFLLAGASSELARKNNWPNRRPVNLFENTYRFGSLVFGGGNVLMPMMYEQYVARPESQKLIQRNPNIIKMNREDFYSGWGMVRAIPGPVFSVCSYIGGIAMKDKGTAQQILGCFIAATGIFLPSALLVLFFFPIWYNLKKYATVYRALEGINAVVVGIILAAALYMMKDFQTAHWGDILMNLIVIAVTWSLLNYSKLPSPVIVLIWLALGWGFVLF